MDSFGDLIERLEQILATLPAPIAGELRSQLKELREVLVDHRRPRIALVGRRGSGKSSLINALFGRKVADVGPVKAQSGLARWFSYESTLGSLEVLDTRGIHEGSTPAEADPTLGPFESIMAALAIKPPDAILFLCKAKEVDSAIAQDLETLKRIVTDVFRLHRLRVPVVGVVTQADELDPPRVALPPAQDEDPELAAEKRANVEKASRHLFDHLDRDPVLKPLLVGVVAIAAFMSFRDDGSIRRDDRWNIDELSRVLFRELPHQARTEFARLSQVKAIQRELAGKVVKTFTSMATGIAATPLPFADLPILTGAQTAMVTAIGYIGGWDMTPRTAIEFLTATGLNVGAALGFREIARAAIKFLFPGGGAVVSGAVAAAGTWALGQAAIAYFIDRRPPGETRGLFEQLRTQKSLEAGSAGRLPPDAT